MTLRLRHARHANSSGEHGSWRALDAERRGRQADPRLGQPRPRIPHDVRCLAPTARAAISREGDRIAELLVGPHGLRREPGRRRQTRNLRGKAFQLFDQAGIVTTDAYDFKGNLLSSSRQLAQDYTARSTGRPSPDLGAETRSSGSTTYDALNRPVTMTTPDGSVYRPAFNEANLLETGATSTCAARRAATPSSANIDYDAKGQRRLIEYGNGTKTEYAYDPLDLPPDPASRPRAVVGPGRRCRT